MTRDEIYKLDTLRLPGGYGFSGPEAMAAVYLREIAAQLSELNEVLLKLYTDGIRIETGLR